VKPGRNDQQLVGEKSGLTKKFMITLLIILLKDFSEGETGGEIQEMSSGNPVSTCPPWKTGVLMQRTRMEISII